MGKQVDYTDRIFGMLLVKNREYDKSLTKFKRVGNLWECLCDCGETVYIYSDALKRGNVSSCGCIKAEKRLEKFTGNKLKDINPSDISWCNNLNCWEAGITLNDERFLIGHFNLVEDALNAFKDVYCKYAYPLLDGNYPVFCKDNMSNLKGLIKKPNILENQRFGMLTVLNLVGNKKDNNYKQKNFWNCKCDCGKYAYISTDDLNNGLVTNCGCMFKKL